MFLRGFLVLAAGLCATGALACDSDKHGDESREESDRSDKKKRKKAESGCEKDTDCKGNRICSEGECVEPSDGPSKSGDGPSKPSNEQATAPPAPPPVIVPPPAPVVPPPLPPPAPADPNSGGSNGPPPSPFVTFAPVDAAAWTPRLGPKMLAGSKVVHTVFEGPFGPSPKSLFAVTERPDKSYYVYVMGDDNKPWPAGPLAEKGTWLAHKIAAVAFFDADKNGTTDALVMAIYKGRAGDTRNRNVLLKWTNLGMRRLLNLEPKIEFMDSAEAIQRKLAE